MKQIPLTQGMTVFLDDQDFDDFGRHYHWCYRGERNGRIGYAIRHARENGKTRTEYLHRAIMLPPPGCEVIFLDHDTLNCTRSNLRVVTKEESRRHHRVRCDSKTGVKGLRYNPDGDTWSAYIHRQGHTQRIGTFGTKDEAIEAYQQAILNEDPKLLSGPDLFEMRDPLADDIFVGGAA